MPSLVLVLGRAALAQASADFAARAAGAHQRTCPTGRELHVWSIYPTAEPTLCTEGSQRFSPRQINSLQPARAANASWLQRFVGRRFGGIDRASARPCGGRLVWCARCFGQDRLRAGG